MRGTPSTYLASGGGPRAVGLDEPLDFTDDGFAIEGSDLSLEGGIAVPLNAREGSYRFNETMWICDGGGEPCRAVRLQEQFDVAG